MARAIHAAVLFGALMTLALIYFAVVNDIENNKCLHLPGRCRCFGEDDKGGRA